MKRSRSTTPSPLSPPSTATPAVPDSGPTSTTSPHASKKLKLLHSYAQSSPFPSHPHPTHTDARAVHDLLAAFHGRTPQRRARPPDWNTVQGAAGSCGHSPNVIDALVSTILSQNTSARNSNAAKASLDAAFGRAPGSFPNIASASRGAVVEAIKHGGLANKKAGVIQNLLAAIKDKHGDYSLQHLAAPGVSDADAMTELVSYDGVGPKTASCVLLFCLQRDSFAVDTHIFRLSKLLGWVPMKADRILTQAHLDQRIPDELKYGLHTLLITHGRQCTGCKARGKGTCPLKEHLKQTGVKAEEKLDAVESEIKDEDGLAQIVTKSDMRAVV